MGSLDLEIAVIRICIHYINFMVCNFNWILIVKGALGPFVVIFNNILEFFYKIQRRYH